MFDQLPKDPTLVAKYEGKINKLLPGKTKNLLQAIWGKHTKWLQQTLIANNKRRIVSIPDAYRDLCGHSAGGCRTLDEFFHPKLTAALASLFGKEETARIREECALVMEFPYSRSDYRPSYRSIHAGDYSDVFFDAMIHAAEFVCYGLAVDQMFTTQNAPSYIAINRAALALRNCDGKICALVEEAMLGENDKVQMSHTIISAIVKSGEPKSMELLGKLLLAAKGQEGLRQAILESCDTGTLDSHIYFIRMILENDLCRFSSVVRAFDTWAGLGFGDQKQKVAEKCMSLALKYLTDKDSIGAGLDSKDTTEIYLALWALCCRDIHSATESAMQLLNSPEKYKRLVGWYFTTHTNGDSYRHNLAVEHLGVRDPEELAWICFNLHINKEACYGWYYRDEEQEESTKTKTYPDEAYPPDKSGRIALFSKIADVAEFIGKKNTRFAESVFPWFSQTLNATAPCGVMLSLAAYDRSADMVRMITDFVPIMSADQRLAYFSLLLNPENPEQRAFLLDGLSDKSKTVRERIVKRLQHYPLGKADIEKLTETLTTQNADLRKGIVTLLDRQKESLIRPALDVLLASQNKNQLIAGVELLDVFSKKNPSLRKDYGDSISSLAASGTVSQDVSILLEKIAPDNKAKETFSEENGYGL